MICDVAQGDGAGKFKPFLYPRQRLEGDISTRLQTAMVLDGDTGRTLPLLLALLLLLLRLLETLCFVFRLSLLMKGSSFHRK